MNNKNILKQNRQSDDWGAINFYSKLFEYKYIICPLGNATAWQPTNINETYRQWEALRCGCIPIVSKCDAVLYFKTIHNIPALIVDNIMNITEELLINSYPELIASLDDEKLTSQYWNNYIRNYA